jgi:thioredoxin reductase (NADPH)
MTLEARPIAFPRLDDEHIAALRRFGTSARFAPGDTLFAAGEIDTSCFVIEGGEVAIVERSKGREHIVAVLGPREFTGDVDMLTGRPAMVSALARAACETLRIPAAELLQVVGELPRVGDLLLTAFLMRRQLLEQAGFAAARVIGSRFCRDTYRVREFLARNKVPFAWIDVDNDPNVHTLLARFGVGVGETPLVIVGQGRMLRSPSNAELGAALGIRKPIERTVYDLAIVGAGPAGLAAAVYGASEGLKTLVLDKTAPGGQAGGSPLIENYMGFPAGLSGAELANRALVQAHKFGARFSLPSEVKALRCERGFHVLEVDGEGEVAAKCVLVSAGASYRRLDATDCARFEGLGLYFAATAVEAELCRRAQVLIVGSGNSAGQAAIFLAERASRVLLALRGDDLRKNMSDYLARRIEHTPNVVVRYHTEVARMQGEKWLSAVELRDRRTGEIERIGCPAAFVFIGAVPHTDWLPQAIGLDADGFVKSGPQPGDGSAWPLARQPYLLETSCPGVFAAGDVRVGSVKRVASAVGEGAMAVKLAHEYLAAC